MGASFGLGKATRSPTALCGMRTRLLWRGFARRVGDDGLGGEGEEEVGGEEKSGGGGNGHERAHRGVRRGGLGRFARPDATDTVREVCGAEALADTAGKGADLGLREVAHAQGGGVAFAGGAHGRPSGEPAAEAVGEEGDFGGEVVDGVDHGVGMGAVEELGKVVVGYAEAFGGGAAGGGDGTEARRLVSSKVSASTSQSRPRPLRARASTQAPPTAPSPTTRTLEAWRRAMASAPRRASVRRCGPTWGEGEVMGRIIGEWACVGNQKGSPEPLPPRGSDGEPRRVFGLGADSPRLSG